MDENLLANYQSLKSMADKIGMSFENKSMEKLLRLYELTNRSALSPEPASNGDMAVLESSAQQSAMDAIKAAIPAMDARYREMLQVFVKLIEMKSMLEVYGQAALSRGEGGDWRSEFLSAFKRYAPLSAHKQIDSMINLLNTMTIINEMKLIIEE